ncbi:MAG: hypothetical protein ABTQ25_04755 [Nitrosomonas ureae]
MTIDNKRPHTASTGTAQNNTIDKPHSTKTDLLQGWYSLGAAVKPSRTERTPKRGWKRNSRGQIDPLLALYVALIVLSGLMIFGGGYA